MFPTDTLTAFLLAVIMVVLALGPDNIQAISRGLSPGRWAAVLSNIGMRLTFIAAGMSIFALGRQR